MMQGCKVNVHASAMHICTHELSVTCRHTGVLSKTFSNNNNNNVLLTRINYQF